MQFIARTASSNTNIVPEQPASRERGHTPEDKRLPDNGYVSTRHILSRIFLPQCLQAVDASSYISRYLLQDTRAVARLASCYEADSSSRNQAAHASSHCTGSSEEAAWASSVTSSKPRNKVSGMRLQQDGLDTPFLATERSALWALRQRDTHLREPFHMPPSL